MIRVKGERLNWTTTLPSGANWRVRTRELFTMIRKWAICSVAAVMLSACGLLSTSCPTYRVKLTVEVETPSGLRKGSNVCEVRTSRTGSNFPASPNQISYTVRGASVAVDLLGGTLFTIMQADSIGSALISAHNYYRRTSNLPEDPIDSRTINRLIREAKPIILPRFFFKEESRSGFPQLVRFRDTNDPASVEWVDPDDLERLFGSGTKIKQLIIQVTDDPISSSIVARLPWLPNYRANQLPFNGIKSTVVSTNDAGANLGAGSFSSELGSSPN